MLGKISWVAVTSLIITLVLVKGFTTEVAGPTNSKMGQEIIERFEKQAVQAEKLRQVRNRTAELLMYLHKQNRETTSEDRIMQRLDRIEAKIK